MSWPWVWGNPVTLFFILTLEALFWFNFVFFISKKIFEKQISRPWVSARFLKKGKLSTKSHFYHETYVRELCTRSWAATKAERLQSPSHTVKTEANYLMTCLRVSCRIRQRLCGCWNKTSVSVREHYHYDMIIHTWENDPQAVEQQQRRRGCSLIHALPKRGKLSSHIFTVIYLRIIHMQLSSSKGGEAAVSFTHC